MSRQSFSAMWTAPLGRALKAACREPYPMEFHPGGDDYQAFADAVGQGIDSHLEAVSFTQEPGAHGRVKFTVAPESMPVLVRRLLESGNEHAESLAGSICTTLEIELI